MKPKQTCYPFCTPSFGVLHNTYTAQGELHNLHIAELKTDETEPEENALPVELLQSSSRTQS